MKTIEITIDAQGQTKVETKGIAGASCKDASRFIEEALGEKLTDQHTAEYFQTEPARQQIGQG